MQSPTRELEFVIPREQFQDIDLKAMEELVWKNRTYLSSVIFAFSARSPAVLAIRSGKTKFDS